MYDLSCGAGLVLDDCLRAETDGMNSVFERTESAMIDMFHYGVLSRIHSRISNGEQANVYHATSENGQEVALKVYTCHPNHLTHIFDIRKKGIKRTHLTCNYRPGAEFIALSKMKAAGVRCPTPVESNEIILVSEFIGQNGVPAPTLSVAPIPLDQYHECYKELIKIMRILYHKCEIVHGDLSETHVLYHEGHLYVIGASQAVETHYVYASELLKRDCAKVLNFFQRRCVAVMSTQELFDLICDPHINDESIDCIIETQKTLARNRGLSKQKNTADMDLYTAVASVSYEVGEGVAVFKKASPRRSGDEENASGGLRRA